jgi:hypothetical protein
MTQSNRLPILQGQIADLHREVLHHTATAAEKAIAAGAALVEAKALCGHGAWGAWLKETGIPERSAQRYMALHRAGLKSATVADLGGIAAAERFLALLTPKGARGWAGAEGAARALIKIREAESEAIEGWLMVGAALNEARKLVSSEREFEGWVRTNLPKVRRDDLAAAMWAAANPDDFAEARAAVEGAQ